MRSEEYEEEDEEEGGGRTGYVYSGCATVKIRLLSATAASTAEKQQTDENGMDTTRLIQ